MTAQAHEILILEGEETSMIQFPDIPVYDSRIIKLDENEINNDGIVSSTSCWRQYIGTWQIKENKLYLIEINGIYKIIDAKPLFAHWYTGEIVVPRGKMLKYVHAGFATIYEEEIHIYLKNGIVIHSEVIDNRKNIDIRWQIFTERIYRENIRLDESNHKYYFPYEPKIDFVSCTTFVEYFFHKFDPIGIANNLTTSHPSYAGIMPQDLVKSWEYSAIKGTQIHKEIDKFIKLNIPPKNDKAIMAVEWLNLFDKNKYEIFSEIIIYSKEIQLAGTVDLIMFNKESKTINIYDWKTTKSIDKISFNSKMGRVPATSNLMDCNYIHYSLQLSLYRYIFEKYYGLKVDKLTLLHLHNNTIISHECNYLKNIIVEMLKYDRKKLAKETEDSLTKEFENSFGFEPEPDFEDLIDPEEFEGPSPEDLYDL